MMISVSCGFDIQRSDMNHYPTYILINPASRSGYSVRIWEETRGLFEEKGFDCQVFYSTPEEEMSALARRLTKGKEHVNLLVFGGDGTINEVLNGIEDFSSVDLGVVPTGSSNDFARAIGLTSEKNAVERILEKTEVVCRDLGEVIYRKEDGRDSLRFFNVSTGIGFDAASCEGVERSRMKRVLNRIGLGKLVYLGVAIRLILTSSLMPFKITLVDDGRQETTDLPRTLFAVCMNHGYEGGGFLFCPAADSQDGKIDLCAASDIGRLRFFFLFPKAYTGAHIGHRGVTVRQGDKIIVECKEPLFLHADGEVLGKAVRMEVRVLPEKIRFLV